MAKAPAKASAPAENPDTPVVAVKSDGGIPILALLILTVLAAGVGGGFGTLIPPLPQPEVEKRLEEKAHTKPEVLVVPLSPITTNLSGSGGTWMRLEATLLMRPEVGENAQILASKVGDDLVGFLRTVDMEQLEGGSGYQHLREDLNDRVRLRSEGKVTELLVQALIIE
jgi:flagellar protein FliL